MTGCFDSTSLGQDDLNAESRPILPRVAREPATRQQRVRVRVKLTPELSQIQKRANIRSIVQAAALTRFSGGVSIEAFAISVVV
jgi:hypothetical protein